MVASIAHVQRSLIVERQALGRGQLIRSTSTGARTAHETFSRASARCPALNAIVGLIDDVQVLIRVHHHRHGIVQLASVAPAVPVPATVTPEHAP